MTALTRANEIPSLVRRLGSPRADDVEAAKARLAIIGARAVEALVEALEADTRLVRLHAIGLLSLIQDPRARAPLVSLLLDRDPRVRLEAARALGRFPHPVVTRSLTRALAREENPDMRSALVSGLLEQHARGQEAALAPVLECLTNRAEAVPVRLAALELLGRVRPRQRRSLVRVLTADPDPAFVREVRRRLAAVEAPAPECSRSELGSLLQALEGPNYATWNEAVFRLSRLGDAALAPLVRSMRRRCHDAEFCARAGMVLRALGPRAAPALARFLDEVSEPLPLQVLVESIGALGEKSSIYRLAGLIERIGECKQGPDAQAMRRVRAKAHLELAKVGSRLAVRDLHDALAGGEGSLEVEMVAALECIGKRDELVPLARAYRNEDAFMRGRIAEAVQAILRRERIRRNSRYLRDLPPQIRDTLLECAGAAKGPARRRSGPVRPTPRVP